MSDHLSSSFYSIEHAKRRAAEFEGESFSFYNSNPYAKVIEQNADGTEDFHKIKLVKPMPVGLSGIAFDALNALRSALDQAGHTIGKAAGTSGKRSHFPFGDTLAEVQSRINRPSGSSKDLPVDIFNLMVSFKPYKGGNDLLWALNKLCNSQKHEIIIPVTLHTGGGFARDSYFERAISVKFPPKWDRTKNEMVLAHIPHGTKCRYNIQISHFIALAKVDVVDGHPVIGVINKLISIVEGIVAGLEAEAKRIGLF